MHVGVEEKYNFYHSNIDDKLKRVKSFIYLSYNLSAAQVLQKDLPRFVKNLENSLKQLKSRDLIYTKMFA